MKKTIVICGATATGKTEIAVQLAKMLQTEVISADSQLVYKGLNIGTAKPTLEEMQGIKHHLIDVVPPTEPFSVAEYKTLAEPIVKTIEEQDKYPILCGGTGFYIQSLLFKRSLGATISSDSIRAKYRALAKQHGNDFVWQHLKQIDPESAKVLHANDVNRVIRAIEIYELTGKKKSAQQEQDSPLRDYLAFAFDYDRAVLYEKINRRVITMLQNGLVEEVQSLIKNGVSPDMQSMQAIGYKEVILYLQNKLSYDAMVALVQQKSRNYAKRQITFFKKLPNICWIAPNSKAIQKIQEVLLCSKSQKS